MCIIEKISFGQVKEEWKSNVFIPISHILMGN